MSKNSTEIIKYIPDLKKYVKSKIKNSYFEDVVQETLLYLLLKIDNIKVTNMKGLLFNTANFFISKARNNKVNVELTDNLKIQNFKCEINYNSYNTFLLCDEVYNKLLTVNKMYLNKLIMQLNGYSIKEIALIQKCNENTVKTHIKRCKDYLKH